MGQKGDVHGSNGKYELKEPNEDNNKISVNYAKNNNEVCINGGINKSTDQIVDTEGGNNVQLEKSVSTLGGIGLIVGSIIGSGIFLSPSSVLALSGSSVGVSLVVWVLSGVLTIFGALCYGELGTSIPSSGGEHAYYLETFGPLPAFLFSWTATLIIRPSAGAIIAMIFGQYIAKPFYKEAEVPAELIKGLAFACIVLLTLVNCFSVRLAMGVQNTFTFAKLACVAILTVIGFIQLGKGETKFFEHAFSSNNSTDYDPGNITLAFYSGLWAYDGWNSLNYATEEMANPSRQLPIAIWVSMVVVIACYVFCNIAYIAVLGPAGILSSQTVARDVGQAFLKKADFIIPVLVGLSCFGAVNGLFFSSGRLVFAAARENHLPKVLSMLHAKKKTPVPSLVFSSIISSLMLIPEASTFESLVNLFSAASWVFYGLSFFALIYLRIKRPEMKRPYKVFLPIPFIMLIIALGLAFIPVYKEPIGSLLPFGLILLGAPVYYLFVRYNITTKCNTNLGLTKWLENQGFGFPGEND